MECVKDPSHPYYRSHTKEKSPQTMSTGIPSLAPGDVYETRRKEQKKKEKEVKITTRSALISGYKDATHHLV